MMAIPGRGGSATTDRSLPSLGDVDWPAVAAAGLVGYALGSLSPAAAAARLRGADLRGTGSGNPGATNAARTMGVKIGVAVGALDAAKGYAPVWWFDRYGAPAGQVAGLAAVAGHVTSPLLKGRGGKGVATSLGAILAVEPLWAVPVLAGFGATVGLTRQVGIGSVVGSAMLVPTSVIAWRGWAGVGFAVGLSGIVLYRHQRNVRSYADQVRSGRADRDEVAEDPGAATSDAGADAEFDVGAVSAADAEPPIDQPD